MKQNTLGYKVKQYLMFAGPGTVLFLGVVIVPFIYGLYLTLTSLECLLKVKKKATFPWPGKVRLRMQGHPSLKSTFLFLLPSNEVDIFIMSNSTRSGSVERCKKMPV